MTLDDFELFTETPANPAAPAPRKCRRHEWTWSAIEHDLGHDPLAACLPTCVVEYACDRCGRLRDVARARLGRNNRKRGGAAELDVARTLGARKVGPLGLPWDIVRPGYLIGQVKKLARWPSLAAVIGWMDAMPVGEEMRAVIVVQAAGQGRRGRRLLIVDLDEYAAHHGDPTREAA